MSELLQIFAAVCLVGAVFCFLMAARSRRRLRQKGRDLLVWMAEHRESLERSYGVQGYRMREAWVRFTAGVE